ncbi:unnamed protein product [Echinostoma caproni]|uniref:Golgi apparatus membrane protein tvp38 n=1 Tax=Echinostoma caproni TaxID=27848 RepID=A0A183A678_9TREM|nr:unnamed protein product [Echinostoma caproni]
MDSANHIHVNALRTTTGETPTGRNTLNTSSRLFEIALQATVANADAAREESEQSGSGIQHKRPSTYASQTRSVHLTPQQWQLLNDYHEHELFIRTRSWGFCVAIFGVGLALFGCGSPAWKWIGNGISTASSLVLYPISASACIRNLISDGVIKLPGWSSSQEPDNLDAMQRYAYTYYLTWIAAVFFMSSFFCMNLDLLIQSFVKPVPFLSALANYLYCSFRRRSRHRSRTSRARSISAVSSTNPRAGTQLSTSPTNPSMGAHKAPDAPNESHPTRANPIPEILLSSYDEEASIEGQPIDMESSKHSKRISRTSHSEEDIHGTGEEGDEEDDEDGDDDDADGEWI